MTHTGQSSLHRTRTSSTVLIEHVVFSCSTIPWGDQHSGSGHGFPADDGPYQLGNFDFSVNIYGVPTLIQTGKESPPHSLQRWSDFVIYSQNTCQRCQLLASGIPWWVKSRSVREHFPIRERSRIEKKKMFPNAGNRPSTHVSSKDNTAIVLPMPPGPYSNTFCGILLTERFWGK